MLQYIDGFYVKPCQCWDFEINLNITIKKKHVIILNQSKKNFQLMG